MTNSIKRFLKKSAFITLLVIGTIQSIIIFGFWIFYLTDDSIDFTDRKIIFKMTGVILPEYKVISTKVTHLSNFDSEETVTTQIEFIQIPDKKLFTQIDEIIKRDKKQSRDLEGNWSNNGRQYKYSLMPVWEKSNFVRSDGFFFLYIDKDSKKASLTYGNY